MLNNQKAGWRPDIDHIYPFAKGEAHHVKEPFPATRCFDQLFFIGDAFCCNPVVETSEGLILFDCMEPTEPYLEMILRGLRDMGHDPAEVRAIILTHGHVDHWGRADHFRDNYGTKIYMSAADEEYAHSPYTRSPTGPMPFSVDGHIEGGDVFKLGDTEIQVYATPGHTVGCLSFIIPVTDNGVAHKMALWGGAGIPRTEEEKPVFINSCEYFAQICRREGADGEISNHTFTDLTADRLAVCRKLVNGMGHPFVIGVEATAQYHLDNIRRCLATMG